MDFTLNVTFDHYSSGSLDRSKHRHSTIKVNIERMTFGKPSMHLAVTWQAIKAMTMATINRWRS
jgi:hypothetical protein